MPIERSIIRLIIPSEISPAIEPYLEISWFGRHPGDKVETSINTYINQIRITENSNFSHIVFLENELVFIYWNHSIKAGIAVLLDLLSIPLWSQYVWRFHTLNPLTWDDLFEEYVNIKLVDFTVSEEKFFNPSWLKASLEGGTIEFESQNIDQFINGIRQFLETFPWTSFLIQSGKITKKSTTLNFMSGDTSQALPYEELFISLAGEPNDDFWILITKAIINMSKYAPEDRLAEMRKALALIYEVTNNEASEMESLLLIKNHIAGLIDLNIDFTLTFVNRIIFEIGGLTPTYELGQLLIETAKELLQNDLIDLAKLTEGTALQFAFSLESFEDKEKIILALTKRSEIWGPEHLIGFIRSITGILSESDEDRKLLSKITDSSTKELLNSWEGLICLVETNIIIGEILKAIELRFYAAKQITDPILRAEDTITALIWALELENLDEPKLFEISISKIEDAISNLPMGDIFQSQITQFVKICLDKKRLIVLDNFITWLETNLIKISLSDRLPLLQMLDGQLSQKREYIELRIPVVLLYFKQLLEENNPEHFEMADNQLRSIYNLIDPNTNNYKKQISQITKSLIVSAGQFGELELIEEARKRFTLMVDDKEFSRIALLDMFIESGVTRAKVDKTFLQTNDMGLILFEEAIKLSFIENDGQLVLDFLPTAKELAFKTQSFEKYTNFTVIETRLNNTLEFPWVDIVVSSARKLLEIGMIKGANYIFSEALNLELSDKEEYNLLSKQLELVEIEPDYIAADAIFKKRKRLIAISNANEEIADIYEILDHYRNGISELIAKGDTIHFNDLLLNAIVFTHKNNLKALIEFNDILLDSFISNVQSYAKTKNQNTHNDLLKIFRKIISTFQSSNIDLALKLAILLIQANFDLVKSTKNITYLIRAQLIVNEIGFIINIADTDSIAYSLEDKMSLINLYKKLLNFVSKYNRSFGTVDVVLYATSFYHNINDDANILSLLDTTLANLKRSAIRVKTFNSGLLLGLLVICEVFSALEGEFRDDIFTALQERALKVLDVVATFRLNNKELDENLQVFRRKLNETPRQALQEFPFSLEVYLNNLDS